MTQPIVNYRLVFQPGIVNKVSHTPPFNEFTAYISSPTHIKTFRCRVTKAGEDMGIDEGTLVTELTDKPAITEFEVVIDAIICMPEAGEYNIAFYVENDEGEWNVDTAVYFMVKINDTYQKFATTTGTLVLPKTS